MNVRPENLHPLPATAAVTRIQAMVFVRDRDSEGVIRQSLSDLGIADAEFIGGGIDAAIAALGQRASPRLLVTDVTGIEDPAVRLNALSEVCEPGVGVVVIGDSNDIRLYRNLKDSGIAEYFFKPLVGNLLTRVFQGILMGGSEHRGSRTGKLVFVMGTHGNDGTTTIATSAAWHLAETGQRRVLLLDLDLQYGDAALQLDVSPSHALREALEHPERVDELFLQRGVIKVTERLGLLAALEPLDDPIEATDEALLTLLGKLLHHYRYVIVDMLPSLAPRLLRVLTMPSVLLLVSSASLVSARDVARWRQQIGPNTPERRSYHVLNKNGAHGSLPMQEFIRAAGRAPDLIIPYEREIGVASNLGVAAVRKCASLQHGLSPLYQYLTGEAVPPPKSFLNRLLG